MTQHRDSSAQGPSAKRAARANALKHGLTAKSLLQQVLSGERIAHCREQLIQELAPSTPLERVLVDELARHSTMLEFSEQAEQAVLRQGTLELSAVMGDTTVESDTQQDAALTAVVASDALDRFTRYRRTHEKSFYTALARLTELREKPGRPPSAQEDRPSPAEIFPDNAVCEEHLRQRFLRPDWRCPRCHHTGGSWLKKTQRWECGGCGHQHGLRSGTVMAGSPLPLTAWCRAIVLLAHRPTASAAEVGRLTGITRQATVGRLVARVLAALVSPDRATLLAGMSEPGAHGRST